MRSFILDPGHGESTPGKRWIFDDGVEAREYRIVRKFASVLRDILVRRGYSVAQTVTGDNDPSLKERIIFANGYPGSVLVSLHTNAARVAGTASGFEIWTSPGETVSDKIATQVADAVRSAGFKVRTQSYNDGDPDFEGNLYVLNNSRGPAVLIELGFHDSRSDVDDLLHNEDAIVRMCAAIADGLTK